MVPRRLPRPRSLLGRALLALGLGGGATLAALATLLAWPRAVERPEEHDASGLLRVAGSADGLRFRDASGVAFTLPPLARVRAVSRPDPTPHTAVRVEFAWGSACADDRCVQPGGSLQFGTMEGATGRWYRDEVARFGGHAAYVQYAYYRPVRSRAAYFKEIQLAAVTVAGAPAWMIRFAEPTRDQPRRSWGYWQVTERYYLNLAFAAPPREAAAMERAIARIVASIRAP